MGTGAVVAVPRALQQPAMGTAVGPAQPRLLGWAGERAGRWESWGAAELGWKLPSREKHPCRAGICDRAEGGQALLALDRVAEIKDRLVQEGGSWAVPCWHGQTRRVVQGLCT